MRALFRGLVPVLGLLSLPAVVWAFFHFLPLVTEGFVLWRAGSYRPAVFELEWARLEDGRPEAVGTVGGRREVFSLARSLPRRPAGLNDLQDLTAGLGRIDVLYDPGATRTSFEGVGVRVLPFSPDLAGETFGRIERLFGRGYGPALGLILLTVAAARLGGRSPWGWLYPSLFFLGAQVPFAAFVVLTELFA